MVLLESMMTTLASPTPPLIPSSPLSLTLPLSLRCFLIRLGSPKNLLVHHPQHPTPTLKPQALPPTLLRILMLQPTLLLILMLQQALLLILKPRQQPLR